MLWPILTFLAITALVVMHLRSRSQLQQTRRTAAAEMETLKQVQNRESLQLQAQQKALLDSMVEGLLVLDERGRISLANRAFASLFGVTVDIRGRTILEAVRLHELAALLEPLPGIS